ncbi:MAG: class I adenylate-forming enzyme family protein [Streptosporangiaceae bacterium]
MWAGSPAMVNALARVLAADRLAYDASSLKVVVYGWAALPPGTLATLRQVAGPELMVFEIFGQTEAIACHRFWPGKWPQTYRPTAPEHNYVGVPSPILASTVMDELGSSLEGKPGVPGEAVYRSPSVAAGYCKDEKASEEAFRYGWFHSGDSCVFDADGLRIMIDRYKDIVKSGGENVSSLRVEAVLHQHPAVQKAAVVGLPHERWGVAVTAIVVLAPDQAAPARHDLEQRDQAVLAQDILQFCRERLAGFETPKRVVFAAQLPETVGGKVLKYKLRDTYRDLYR